MEWFRDFFVRQLGFFFLSRPTCDDLSLAALNLAREIAVWLFGIEKHVLTFSTLMQATPLGCEAFWRNEVVRVKMLGCEDVGVLGHISTDRGCPKAFGMRF